MLSVAQAMSLEPEMGHLNLGGKRFELSEQAAADMRRFDDMLAEALFHQGGDAVGAGYALMVALLSLAETEPDFVDDALRDLQLAGAVALAERACRPPRLPSPN